MTETASDAVSPQKPNYCVRLRRPRNGTRDCRRRVHEKIEEFQARTARQNKIQYSSVDIQTLLVNGRNRPCNMTKEHPENHEQSAVMKTTEEGTHHTKRGHTGNRRPRNERADKHSDAIVLNKSHEDAVFATSNKQPSSTTT